MHGQECLQDLHEGMPELCHEQECMREVPDYWLLTTIVGQGDIEGPETTIEEGTLQPDIVHEDSAIKVKEDCKERFVEG